MIFSKFVNAYKEIGQVGFIICSIAFLFISGGFALYKVISTMMHNQQQVIEVLVHNQIIKTYELQKEEHQEKFKKQLQIIPEVNSLLEHFCKDNSADHVMIAEFHNSIENIASAVPFCKFSVTYENSENSIVPFRNELQSSNISNYKSIAKISSTLYLKYSMNELKAIDKLLYYQLIDRGVKQVYMTSIESNDMPCGFILILQYHDKDIQTNNIMTLRRDISRLIKR